MKIKKQITIGVVFVLFLIYGGISLYFSNQLVYFQPKTYEEDKKHYKIKSIDQVGLKNPEDITWEINGVKLSGWYFTGKNQCGVIFHHGYKGTRFRMLTYIPLFKEYNCHLLLFDARHHGNSTGEFGTFGYYEKFDILEIIEWFKNKTKLEDKDIVLFGESMGASTVIQAAGYSKRKFKMILAESPFSDLHTIVKERSVVMYTKFSLIFLPVAFFLSNLRTGADLYDVSPVKYASNIQTPILIVHSLSDDYTNYYHSERIFQALTIKEKDLFLTDWGSKHPYSIDDNFNKYYEYFKNFIKKYNINF